MTTLSPECERSRSPWQSYTLSHHKPQAQTLMRQVLVGQAMCPWVMSRKVNQGAQHQPQHRTPEQSWWPRRLSCGACGVRSRSTSSSSSSRACLLYGPTWRGSTTWQGSTSCQASTTSQYHLACTTPIRLYRCSTMLRACLLRSHPAWWCLRGSGCLECSSRHHRRSGRTRLCSNSSCCSRQGSSTWCQILPLLLLPPLLLHHNTTFQAQDQAVQAVQQL
mmetsp:Transcript_25486/g.55413  ORF Transcript_25486/g.55413 Transcript_25486/m.55413 type:complete len:220 (+) Transcript_25486:543-1202(+)